MYKILIAFLITLTAAMLHAQTTPRSPRSGATQSVNAGKTTLAPAQPSPAKQTSGSSRDAKTQKQTERPAAPATNTTRTETSERSGTTDAVAPTAKGSYKPGSSSTKTTTPKRTGTRPAYTSPSKTSSNAPRTSTVNTKKAKAKPEERVTINWLTLEQAIEKSKTEKRKIFVDVYTSWCGWCKHMDSTTFVSGAVAKYLNEHYYPVKFNAEQQGDIVFKDKTYHFKKSGTRGHHELAAEWLNNRLTFPTIVFLDENMNLIQPLAGYQDAFKMEAIINYFATDSHKKTPWEAYEKKFVPQQ